MAELHKTRESPPNSSLLSGPTPLALSAWRDTSACVSYPPAALEAARGGCTTLPR